MDQRPEENDILQRLKTIFDSIVPAAGSLDDYPKEALPIGTYVRPTSHNKLGVITDAFYGDVDANNTKIIVYTILIFPQIDPITRMPKDSQRYYVTNVYEYEVIAYLMMKPADLAVLGETIVGGIFG